MSALCIGEALIVLSPVAGQHLRDAHTFAASVAGAEANVAIALSELGVDAWWAGLVGDDPFGERVIDVLSARGVHTALARTVQNAPTGVYFKPGDGGPVRYYRSGSAGSRLNPAVITEWAGSGPSAELVHITGVSLQASESGRESLELIVADRPFGQALVAFDVNHRPALATTRTSADLLRVARGSDIVFVGLDEAARLWDVHTPEDVRVLLPDPTWLIVKDASTEAVEFHRSVTVRVPAPQVSVLEPTGAGDAFAAGWLSSFLLGEPADQRLARGHAIAGRVLMSTKDHLDREGAAGAAA